MPSSPSLLIALLLALGAWSGTAQIDVTGRYEHEAPITASLEVVREDNRYVVRLAGGVPSGQGAATPADCLIEARGALDGAVLHARFGSEREPRVVRVAFEPGLANVLEVDTLGYCPLLSEFTGRYQKVEQPRGE